MPPVRREIDPNPVLRTVCAHTGAEFEGQLLNRQRGEQLEGVEVVNARDAEQGNVEQPGLCPVPAAPVGGAAQVFGDMSMGVCIYLRPPAGCRLPTPEVLAHSAQDALLCFQPTS